MRTYELIKRRRVIRKFTQKKIDNKDLLDCINAGRLAASSANLQPLEYILVTQNIVKIFDNIAFAGYAKKAGPRKGEEPTAYIVVISNTEIILHSQYDVGLAVGNIVITALERGIATAIIGNVKRPELGKFLRMPKNYTLELVIALGYPAQASIVDGFKGDIRYWLDEQGVVHVPKRNQEDILHEEFYTEKERVKRTLL